MEQKITDIKNAFINFSFTDAIDILILAVLIFALLRFVWRRNAKTVVWYLAAAFVLYAVIFIFQDYLRASWRLILYFAGTAILILIVIFAPDIKHYMLKLSRGIRRAEVYSTEYDVSDEELRRTISELIRAAQNMSKKNMGALIIISPQHIQPQILESGTSVGAVVSAPLLESIFNTKAPMHDGAVIVRANRILAAGCFLPLSQNTNIPQELGTRHRAALGVSENNDVLSIIISEQTGVISICKNGIISRYFDSTMLQDALEQVYGLKMQEGRKRKKKRKYL